MDLYHRNTAVHSPNLTLSVPPVQSLLNDYYQALTHVCSTGLQLAGRLDKELASNRNSSDNHNGNIQADSNCSSDLRRNIKQLTHVYSDIISKMKPLWEQIQMECTADNERSTLNHHGKQTSAVSRPRPFPDFLLFPQQTSIQILQCTETKFIFSAKIEFLFVLL